MIKNGKDTLLNQNSGTLPNMRSTVEGWMQPMTIFLITQTTVNSKTVETKTQKDFKGTWQPMSRSELQYRPRDQRHWKWFKIHSTIDLSLNVDDIISYNGREYRVKDEGQYELYGYRDYSLIERYQT